MCLQDLMLKVNTVSLNLQSTVGLYFVGCLIAPLCYGSVGLEVICAVVALFKIMEFSFLMTMIMIEKKLNSQVSTPHLSTKLKSFIVLLYRFITTVPSLRTSKKKSLKMRISSNKCNLLIVHHRKQGIFQKMDLTDAM